MAESDPTPILHSDAPDKASKRGAKRDSLFLLTTLLDEAGQPLGKARVRNLSETGLMADCDSHLRDGDRLVVRLRGVGDVAGRVTWVRGDRIGMAFDGSIDPRAARKPVGARSAESGPPFLRKLVRKATPTP
ncbi:PilZ domain-containing protein [Sphingobium lignivorans]|uniref:PilZ domain-containing protein n=1 Tax=Sphingobium lignivorans TaxID=2735886 RepID=A0ABR6NJ09_9SPHN|nr:PilZ domain-containing protein [Sphingobium lignivorans]MBB5987254.1 hypothetical protein [Sphingobium lignivorans]